MAGLPTATGQNTDRGHHPGKIIWVSFTAYEHHRQPSLRKCHRPGRIKNHLSDSRTRGRRNRLGDERPITAQLELRHQQLGKLRATDAGQGLILGDQALVQELTGDPKGSPRGSLANTCLEHPKFPTLNGELDIAKISIMGLKAAHRQRQLLGNLAVLNRKVSQRQSVANSRDYVLTLCIR